MCASAVQHFAPQASCVLLFFFFYFFQFVPALCSNVFRGCLLSVLAEVSFFKLFFMFLYQRSAAFCSAGVLCPYSRKSRSSCLSRSLLSRSLSCVAPCIFFFVVVTLALVRSALNFFSFLLFFSIYFSFLVFSRSLLCMAPCIMIAI